MNKIKSYILFLILLTMLSPATFGMAQTIIVKDSITHEAVPFVSVVQTCTLGSHLSGLSKFFCFCNLITFFTSQLHNDREETLIN